MIRRLLEVFRRPPPPPRHRPNELRLDQVRAERRRREALRATVPPAEEERSRREPEPPLTRPARPPLLARPIARADLRRALLLEEIIRPPLAVRERDSPAD